MNAAPVGWLEGRSCSLCGRGAVVLEVVHGHICDECIGRATSLKAEAARAALREARERLQAAAATSAPRRSSPSSDHVRIDVPTVKKVYRAPSVTSLGKVEALMLPACECGGRRR